MKVQVIYTDGTHEDFEIRDEGQLEFDDTVFSIIEYKEITEPGEFKTKTVEVLHALPKSSVRRMSVFRGQ